MDPTLRRVLNPSGFIGTAAEIGFVFFQAFLPENGLGFGHQGADGGKDKNSYEQQILKKAQPGDPAAVSRSTFLGDEWTPEPEIPNTSLFQQYP